MKVGTFAWNHHRHLEAYFGVPGTGAILHMINIRLSPEHIAYVINHAGDEILLVDDNLFPHLEKLAPYLKTVKHYIIMGDSTEIPETSLENVHSYEALLAEASEDFVFPEDLMKIHQQACATHLPQRAIQKGSPIHIVDLYCIVMR